MGILNVVCHAATSAIGFLTYITYIGSFICMSTACMTQQSTFPGKLLSANFTLKIPFFLMDALNVGNHAASSCESLVTNITNMTRLVCRMQKTDMLKQSRFLPEFLSACTATIRFCSTMNKHVPLKIGVFEKTFLAYLTKEWFWSVF